MSVVTSQREYISPAQRKTLDIKQFQRSHDVTTQRSRQTDFYALSEQSRQHVYAIYDKKVEQRAAGETKEDYVNIYHEAMQGIPSSVSLIKRHIDEYVVEQGLKDTAYPEYYQSLVDALFEEEFGWGPLSAFRYERNCEGAQVLGCDIKFKRSWGWELQTFRFRDIQQVMDLAQRFSNMNVRTTLNEHTNPEMETKTHDNIRVSIMIPERMHAEPVITMRRKVIRDLSFKNLADYGTLPPSAIPLFESLSRFQVNSVIAGPPGCGKSTMLQAFLHYACYEVRNGKKVPERINTVFAETYPEFDVRDIHPSSNMLHMIGRGEEFEKIIMASILRHDIGRVVLGEIREHEVGLYRRASLQGIKQVMGTLHDLDPINIPEIMGNLYMQYYPNGNDPKSVYQTFARNLHFAVSMDEVLYEDEKGYEHLEKKVTGIHLYEVDSESSIKMYTIMDYDLYTKEWTFNSNIPERFERMVRKYHREAYEQFVTTLSSLEKRGAIGEGD